MKEEGQLALSLKQGTIGLIPEVKGVPPLVSRLRQIHLLNNNNKLLTKVNKLLRGFAGHPEKGPAMLGQGSDHYAAGHLPMVHC